MLGIVNVYKPKGVTSFHVVSRLKKIYNTKHVGHLGTLDPMAEGVLPVAINKATKLFDYYLNKDKEYIASFLMGQETDTLDSEGVVINTTNNIIQEPEFKKSLINFKGEILQTPPKYSAIKINGRRAYDLARKGVEFEIKPKKVTIYNLELLNREGNIFNVKIHCSAGTYIRSLGRDIFYSLNNMCTMVKLVRTRAGGFNVEDSRTLEEIEKDPKKALISPQVALKNHTKFVLDKKHLKHIVNGVQLDADKLKAPEGEFLLFVESIFIGLAENKNGKIVVKINMYEGE